jgi:hypothetical protein
MNTVLPATLQEFCAFFAQGEANQQILFEFYQYGEKERERYRVKDKKRQQRLKEERLKKIESGEIPAPKIGRPRKHPLPNTPSSNCSA